MDTSFFWYPALLFPAIPLMMNNFTQRYNSCSGLIRRIHDEFINKKISKTDKSAHRYLSQIDTLKKRLILIQIIKTLSSISFILNLATIYFGYKGSVVMSMNVFGAAVIFFTVAMLLFIAEIFISVKALHTHLEDLNEL